MFPPPLIVARTSLSSELAETRVRPAAIVDRLAREYAGLSGEHKAGAAPSCPQDVCECAREFAGGAPRAIIFELVLPTIVLLF